MENPAMKLLVLYGEQGRIVSLRRVPTGEDGGPATPMRSGVAPGKGQRVAEITLDAPFHEWPLKDLHEQFSVEEEEGRPRLVHRRKIAAAE
jgi:hypothetical protein